MACRLQVLVKSKELPQLSRGMDFFGRGGFGHNLDSLWGLFVLVGIPACPKAFRHGRDRIGGRRWSSWEDTLQYETRSGIRGGIHPE